MDKDGDMTIGTIIAIVLGIAVLVFLIFGFSTGWNSLWNRISPIANTDSNVDALVSGCQVACSGVSQYAYCSQQRTLRLGKDWCEGKEATGENACETTVVGNCTYFAEQYRELGFRECTELNC